jgi:hypothetical protein
MRIDRDAFFVAVAALAGCERTASAPPPAASQPGAAAHMRELPPAPEPAPPAPPPAPKEPVVETTLAPPAPSPGPPHATHRRRVSAAKQWLLGLAADDRSDVIAVCKHRREDPCAGLLAPPPRAATEEAKPDPEKDAANLPRDKVAAYCQEVFPAPTCDTPLVVAFEGQPVEFAHAGRDRFAFVPGQPTASDWPTAVTPWIALDRDGDGEITTGAELFGSSTVLANGGLARDGFSALAALDDNADGAIDARDSMFAKLVLWRDRNGDRRGSPDELQPLSQTVTSISLASRSDPRCNERDDCEGERSALQWRDGEGRGHAGAVIDVYIPSKR